MAAPGQNVRSDEKGTNRQSRHTATTATVIDHSLAKEILTAADSCWNSNFRRAEQCGFMNAQAMCGGNLQITVFIDIK